jgi:N-sulfoglucosamine sulfohydrolase
MKTLIFVLLLSSLCIRHSSFAAQRPHILCLTVDDMSYDSVNALGNPMPGLTPNIDRLIREGFVCKDAHVPSSVCGPSRQSMITALHPHRNGSLGFVPVSREVPSLPVLLRKAGYHTMSHGKDRDYDFDWDEMLPGFGGLGFHRDNQRQRTAATAAIRRVLATGKPFYFGINTSDPHRPFPNSPQERERLDEINKRFPTAKNKAYFPDSPPFCKAEAVHVPAWLPDLPAVREELAQYYTGVHRADDFVGQMTAMIEELGLTQDTLIIFFSDNGLSLPSAKGRAYPHSTRTPLIFRWPGKITPGASDKALVSTMDILPTLLEITAQPPMQKSDGLSLWPLLQGRAERVHDSLLTSYNYFIPGWQVFPVRALLTEDAALIVNFWRGSKSQFLHPDGRRQSYEPHSGHSFPAMLEAEKTDPTVKARLAAILTPPRTELYDRRNDPASLRDLSADPQHESLRQTMLDHLRRQLTETGDPLLPTLESGTYPPAWDTRIKGQSITQDGQKRE